MSQTKLGFFRVSCGLGVLVFLLALGATSQAQMTLQGTVNVFVLDGTGGAFQGAKLAPQNPAPCLLLATAYRKRGRIEQAQAMLAMVAKLNEEQAEKRRQTAGENR
jgi:hypothetical protein